MTRAEWTEYWSEVERTGTPEVIEEPQRAAREMKCVLCWSRDALSIVWSVSFGESPDRAEQVIVCKECRRFCNVCDQPRVCDEVYGGACDRCRIVAHIENDMYSRVAHYREELAQWDGAEAGVAYQDGRLLSELKRAERELKANATSENSHEDERRRPVDESGPRETDRALGGYDS